MARHSRTSANETDSTTDAEDPAATAPLHDWGDRGGVDWNRFFLDQDD